MSFFVFPQSWITPAITAAVIAFGPIDKPDDIKVHYINLPTGYLAAAKPPSDIAIDKLPKREWPKWKAQCVIAHEYGHLAGKKHVSKGSSIMRRHLIRKNCLRFLRRHRLR